MPYPNFHSARIREPGSFVSDSMRTISITSGITAIIGRLKSDPSGGTKVQTYRFDKTKYSTDEAKKWLDDHNIKYISFEAASNKDEESIDVDEPILEFIRKDRKKHIVSGIVLSPNEADLDSEFVDEDGIEEANISYMTKLSSGSAGSTISHSKPVGLGSEVALIENYIAPVDIKFNDATIKKGTWIQSYKIFDTEIWDMIENNEIVGFSIGALLRKEDIS